MRVITDQPRPGSSIPGRPSKGVKRHFFVLLLIAAGAAAGCSSQPVARDTVELQQAVEKRAAKQEINAKLASAASTAAANQQLVQSEYAIGSGDLLEITVFGVDELNKTVRVTSSGRIMLPLVGELDVGGRSPRQVEQMLDERLVEYMHDPEVSVFIAEYRSQRVSVTGAVNNPTMHTLTQPRTVLELVSMSGGLSPEAGNQIYVQTKIDNQPQRLIVDLEEVLSGRNENAFRLLLSGGDNVFVPEAGVVFVEGAVNEPGSYPLQGNRGIIEAVAMAGGTKFDARESEVQVITRKADGETEVISVPLDQVRAHEVPNYSLQDGDIVIVPSNAFKRNFAGFWRGFRGVFGMGYSINGP